MSAARIEAALVVLSRKLERYEFDPRSMEIPYRMQQEKTRLEGLLRDAKRKENPRCNNCRRYKAEHAGEQCLFEPTFFQAMTEIQNSIFEVEKKYSIGEPIATNLRNAAKKESKR